MVMPHECLECGEHTNIGMDTIVYVNWCGEPSKLEFTFTCLRCNHQWTVTTGDFTVDFDRRPPDER